MAKAYLFRFAAGLLVLAGCARLSSCGEKGWEIEHIEERWNNPEAKEDLITFRNRKTWDNLGMKTEKIAEIRGTNGNRVIAFKALSCVECEADLLLIIRSTAGEKVISEPYPGKMTSVDIDTGVSELAPFAEVRVFAGKCLDGKSDEVFIIETTAQAVGKPHLKVITPTETGLDWTRIETLPEAARGPRVNPAQLNPDCRELTGVDRFVE